MIIVTPAVGWPEPRPQSLITGDRAVTVLDNVTSTALQKSGVKLVTVPAAQYQLLIDQLVPEVMDGLDPITHKLVEQVIPDRLSEATLEDIDLRGVDGKVEEQYIPDRLSSTNLSAMLDGAIGTVVDTDPDGTPVIIAGGGVESNFTVTGTLTAGTANISSGHADVFTISVLDVAAEEVNTATYVQQTGTIANPSSGKFISYVDTTGRLIYKDSAGTVYRNNGLRTVTSWSTTGAQLGDQAINSTTGEHRIYKGTTLGWRLASPWTVANLTDRNAIAGLYAGYSVFCNFGQPQNQYWDGTAWRGTKDFLVNGGSFTTISGVNDTNTHTLSTTSVTDPGYSYQLLGQVNYRVLVAGVRGVYFSSLSVQDTNGANNVSINNWLSESPPSPFQNIFPATSATTTTALTGDKQILLRGSGSTANMSWGADGNFVTQRWWVKPA